MGECFVDGELETLATFATGVAGHSGRLALYNRTGGAVLVSFGRRHLYEGVGSDEVTTMIRTAAALGVRTCILTNAAGGLNPLLQSGDVMMIEGMIGLLLGSRAVLGARAGSEGEGEEERSRDETHRPVLAAHYHSAILDAAWRRGMPLRAGVYASLSGPSYETRAEIRMLRSMGAHAVGMSTFLEAAAAAREGMEVVAFSLITNTLTDTLVRPLGHDEVIDVGARSVVRVRGAIDAALDVLHETVG